MEAKGRVLLVGMLVLVTGAVALWSGFGRNADIGMPAAANAVGDQGTASAVDAPVARAEMPVDEPAADALPEPAAQRSEVPVAALKMATIRGRCVDAAGEPLAGCKARLNAWQGNSKRMEEWLTQHGRKPEWKEPAEAITAADGVFAVTFWPPPPYQFALDVGRDGCVSMSGRWTTLAEGSQTDVGDVRLVAGVRVTGRVVDASGAPASKARVSLSRNGGARRPGTVGPRGDRSAVCQADGTFAVHGWLLPGDYGVAVDELELQSPKSLTLTAERPHEVAAIVVATPAPTVTITGCVMDETGAPAQGVEISAHSDSGGVSDSSGRDGTFELRRLADDAKTALLSLTADGYEVDEQERRRVDWGATDVEFRVVRAGALTLRLTDSSTAPVESYTVRLIPRRRFRWSSNDSRARAQGRHEDGTVVIPGLTRGDWLLLVDFAAATDFAPLFVEFSHAGGDRGMDLQVAAAAARKIRVVAGDDTPVAGTVVQLCDVFDLAFDDNCLVMARDTWLMNLAIRHALVLSQATTGADGRVELRGPVGRNLGLCLLGPGHVPLRQSGVRLDLPDELVVRVSRGARLVGRIVPPEAVAELQRLTGGNGTGGFEDSWRPRLGFAAEPRRRFPVDHMTASRLACLRIADDGTFDVPGVPPGFWQVEIEVMIRRENSGGHSQTFPAGGVTLIDGETVTRDLDLTDILPGTVDGAVLLNGQRLPSSDLALSPSNSQGAWVPVRTDAEGRFSQRLMAGDYQLLLPRATRSRSWFHVTCPTPVRVVRGQTTTMTFSLSSTVLKLTVLDPAGKPVDAANVAVVGGSKVGAWLPPTDASGVTQAELTSETVTVRVLPKDLASPEAQQKFLQEGLTRGDSDPFASRWVQLQTITLVAGQTMPIELRLPASAGY